MKKITLLLSLIITCISYSFAQVLNDNFDDLSSGAFGNSGSVMSNTTGLTISSSRTGWDLANSSKVYSGAGTIKLGTSSAKGYIKTNSLNLNGSFTISFNACAWSGDATTFDIQLNGSTIQTITTSNSTIADYYLLQSYQVTGTGTGSDVITFTAKNAANNRFLLDDIYITIGSTVATPTFSIASGLYNTAQTVSISSTTNGATIYYTTDGTTPTTSSNIYSTPLNISSTTKIKAIAIAQGMSNSGVALAAYSFPIEVGTLSELQTYMPSSGTSVNYYKYTGNATISFVYVNNAIQNIYLQDQSGGMYIFDGGKKLNTTYKEGDNVTGFIGQITNYGAAPEFIPTSDFTISSSNNSITPVSTTLNDASSQLFKLASINNVSFAAADGSALFVAATNYTISDTSGSSILRIPTSTFDYVGEIIPSTANLVAIISKYTNIQLIPRTKNDINQINTSVNTISSSAKFIKSGNQLLFSEAINGSTVEIFSVLGAKVQTSVIDNGRVELNNLQKGIYIVRLGKQTQKIVL